MNTNYTLQYLPMRVLIEGRRRGRQRIRWSDGITNSMVMGFSNGQGSLACCSPWNHKELDVTE